jgi:hypothetical protein
MYTKSTNRHPTHALYEADVALIKFRQGDDMSNSDFLEKFKSLLDIFIHAGGNPGCAATRYRDFALDSEEDPDNNADDYTTAVNRCHDEWVGMVLVLKSDPKCYSTLKAKLINSYTRRQDVYPNNPTGAYNMLVNYHSPTSHVRTHVQDHGLAFVQDTDASGCSGHGGRGGCGGSGRAGRGGCDSGSRDTNATITSSSNNNNTNEQITESYTACSLFDSRPAECFLQNSAICHLWILIDSCSSVNMFANKELLHDIKPTTHPINVHCNAGTISVSKTGLFGDYPERVWFNPHGILPTFCP